MRQRINLDYLHEVQLALYCGWQVMAELSSGVRVSVMAVRRCGNRHEILSDVGGWREPIAPCWTECKRVVVESPQHSLFGDG